MPVASPCHVDDPDRPAGEVEQQRERVLDVPAALPGLREPHRAGRGLHRHDVSRDRPLQVDVVAAALEDLAAALAAVHEPRPGRGRPVVAPDHHPDLLARERRSDLLEQLRRVPLIADRADRGAAQ